MGEKKKKNAARPGAEIDEGWMGEWIKLGLKEMGESLANHAAFDAYYEKREKV